MMTIRGSLTVAVLLCAYTNLAEGCGAGVGGAVGGGAGAVGGGAIHAVEGVFGKCIHEEAQVRLADGMRKRVKDLRIGDPLVAYSPEKGVHVSPIIGELHNDNETVVSIVEIETSTGRKIPVTPMHSLFVRPCLSDGDSWSTKAAHEVIAGECVPRYHDEGDVAEEAVTNVRVFNARGIRQPVTETGTIVVDDVVISCYDRVVNQDATHIALFPYRWLMGLTKSYAAHLESIAPSLYNLITLHTSLF